MPTDLIAVVGRGCVLPGASTPEAFWNNVAEGRSSISHAPDGRWRNGRDSGYGRPGDKDVPIGNVGGYVTDRSVDVVAPSLRGPLDSALASVLRRGRDTGRLEAMDLTADALDPLFHWIIRCVDAALSESGQQSRTDRAGLIMGNLSYPSTGSVDFAERVWFSDRTGRNGFNPDSFRSVQADPMNRFLSGLPVQLAARTLGLGLGGFALDAACASSLYAIALACGRLIDHSADVMIAGGANRADDFSTHISFSTLSALSPTGQSRPFHRDADGLVPGEGAAAVVLMRLADALASDARIFGVIRGIGLSNDGRQGGLLAPSENGQARAMRAAYRSSGTDPSSVGLLECHATGTPVGDRAEIRSTADVFSASRDLPVGSTKSNIGHLLTAAGAAGILKILGALGSATRPMTLHVDEPSAALDGTPLRPVRELEEWAGPRRAAISAFGFGGNNAHLIVDAWTGDDIGSPALPTRVPAPQVAVVALGADVGTGTGVVDLRADLLSGRQRMDPREDILVDMDELVFPPSDLADSMPQQVLLLQTTRNACRGIELPSDRTMVVVGMGCDLDVGRYTARWRVSGWTDESDRPLSAESAERLRDSIRAAQSSAGVSGSMPNVVANRINAQLGITGPGFTVSAEELSGTVALEVATDSLKRGDIDAAVVGSVDLSHEVVHRTALRSLGIDVPPGDAAVVLVLKRLDDARRAGDSVLAVIGDRSTSALSTDAENDSLLLGDVHNIAHPRTFDPTTAFGRSHAAHGLLSVAIAVLATHHRFDPRAQAPAAPSLGSRPVDVAVDSLAGGPTTLIRMEPADASPVLFAQAPVIHLFAGNSKGQILTDLDRGHESASGSARLVIIATPADLLERVADARRWLEVGGQLPTGVMFGDRPVDGDIVFVFSGGSMAYQGMGRELMLAFPEIVDKVKARSGSLEPLIGWAYGENQGPAHAMHQVWGASIMAQMHAGVSCDLLGIAPAATIGYSSGEIAALISQGAWPDPKPITALVSDQDVALSVASSALDRVREVWRREGIAETKWVSYLVEGPVAEVRAAVEHERSVHVTVVNTQTSCVIGGGADACARIVRALDHMIVLPVSYDIPAHVPELQADTDEWREIYRLSTVSTGIRTYTCSTATWYTPTIESAARAVTDQQLGPIDFAATVEQAWQDGGRVFIEHGPRSFCSSWIRRILGDREHFVVSLDSADGHDVTALVSSVGALLAAGIPLNHAALNDHLARGWTSPHRLDTSATFSAHAPGVVIPANLTSRDDADAHRGVENFSPARGERSQPIIAPADTHRITGASHREMLMVLAETHRDFLAHRRRGIEQLTAHERTQHIAAAPTAPMVLPTSGPRGLPGRSFGRDQLERFAGDTVVAVLGDDYAYLDRAVRRIRLPSPPLLMVDEVLGIDAVQGELGASTIWTRTRVASDAWYLDPAGRMSAGAMAESGQASLISLAWIGADALSDGARVYRLLGCTVTYHRELPRPGEDLRFEIVLDEYVPFGDPPLFTFRMECFIGEVRALTITGGQAGLFTDDELAGATGLSWQPSLPGPSWTGEVTAPPVVCERGAFGADRVSAFAEGRAVDCFGPGWELTETHVRTPRISNGRGKYLDEVTVFDPRGGPWKRGYLAARMNVDADLWFFGAHFPKDPCMPGTLMAEGCMQAMAFYLAASGYTIDRDGWRFEPVPDVPFLFELRGQVVPANKEVVYEVFVHDVVAGPEPTLIADVLCTVDGVKACHIGVAHLRLVPDWPLDQWRHLRSADVQRDGVRVEPATLGGLVGTRRHGPVLRADGFAFDDAAMLACAWGKPSDAFGPPYARFDNHRHAARLPSPPFLFVTRAVSADGPAWQPEVGTGVVVEYVVPDDVWFYEQNDHPVMPLAVAMEVVLQACGWCAGFLGSALRMPTDLYFRNLGGTAVFTENITPGTKVLTSEIRLSKVVQDGDVILETFQARCFADGRPWCTLETVFGFFPRSAIVAQVGIEPDVVDRQGLEAESMMVVDLAPRPQRYFGGSLRLPGPMLQMIDRVTGWWPTAGTAGLGRLRAEKAVSAGDWFFAAHFFQDPVQPGSLGVQAVCQLVQFFVIHGWGARFESALFEPVAVDTPLEWMYRGQVTPENRLVTVTADILSVEWLDEGMRVTASGSLWADGLLIYRVHSLSVEVRAQ